MSWGGPRWADKFYQPFLFHGLARRQCREWYEASRIDHRSYCLVVNLKERYLCCSRRSWVGSLFQRQPSAFLTWFFKKSHPNQGFKQMPWKLSVHIHEEGERGGKEKVKVSVFGRLGMRWILSNFFRPVSPRYNPSIIYYGPSLLSKRILS